MENQITQINLSKYPSVFNGNPDTPFWRDLYKFYENPQTMNRAEFNLICSKRDISLWTKIGMKPHRGWKVSDAKEYFAIKGTKDTLLVNFMEVFNQYQDLKKEIESVAKSGNQIELVVK